MTYYIVGGSTFDNADYKVYAYCDHSGYPDGEYGNRPIQVYGSQYDPYWTLGLDTETMASGQQHVEIGLLDSWRLKITASGMWGYHTASGWMDILGGGGGATPDHNDLEGLNAGDDYEHITQTQKTALHSIYTLEQHDNGHHSTNYHTESDGTGTVTVHSDVTDEGSGIIISDAERTALHAKYTDPEAVTAVETAGLDFGAHVNPIMSDNVAQYSRLGRCQIGINGSGYAYYGYIGIDGNTFMIRQSSAFATVINAATTQVITFMNNGATVGSVGGTKWAFNKYIDMNSLKITELANGTVASDAMAFGQRNPYQDSDAVSAVATADPYLKNNANDSTSGRLTITYTDDVDLVGVSGGLIVGGDGTGQHIAIDGNEIQSKATATTTGTLSIQNLGGNTAFGAGNVTSTGKIYDAVYNDYADYVPLAKGEIKKSGMCYYETGKGLAICNKKNQMGAFGICSDTYGFATGPKKGAVPISVAGIVLAYVDKVYKAGTILINNKDGILTKAKKKERYNALAMFMRKENKIRTKNVYVKGRYWVKVK